MTMSDYRKLAAAMDLRVRQLAAEGVTILRVPLRVTKPGLYRLQMHAEGAGQVVNRTALIRFLAERPASSVWQDVRPLRIAVVRGVKGLGSLGSRLGRGYLVRGVDDSALYTVVDTKFPTAAVSPATSCWDMSPSPATRPIQRATLGLS